MSPSLIDRTMKLSGNQLLEVLELIKRVLFDERSFTVEDCFFLASCALKKCYNEISQLFYNFQLDQKTMFGTLFWSSPKCIPKPLKFDNYNPLHIDYIAASAILGSCIDTSGSTGNGSISKLASTVPVPEFNPECVFEL